MNPIRWLAILFAASLAHAGTIYTVVDLGTLGGSSAEAFAVSSNGLVAGSATTAFGYEHAFTSSGSAGSGLTDLTLNSGATEGMAAAINAAGQAAGTQYINGQAFATLWTDAVGKSVAGAGSYANAINGSGQVAGMISTDGQGHAFVTSPTGVITDLGDLPGGTWSSAYGINNSGQVAGYGQTSPGVFSGFIWTPGVGYTELATLGGANSYAMSINNQGEVAGSAQLASGYLHAVTSTGGALLDLGTLGGNSSYAYSVNDAGEVVGYSYVDSSGVSHAFLFENGSMVDLNDLIGAGSGWTLTAAYAINGSGQIAGTGILDGVEQAFLLDPESVASSAPLIAFGASEESEIPGPSAVPEPSTWSLFLIAVPLMFLMRLRLRQRRLVRLPAPPRSSAWRP